MDWENDALTAEERELHALCQQLYGLHAAIDAAEVHGRLTPYAEMVFERSKRDLLRAIEGNYAVALEPTRGSLGEFKLWVRYRDERVPSVGAVAWMDHYLAAFRGTARAPLS